MKPHFTLKFFGIIFAFWVEFLVPSDQIFVIIAFMDFVLHFIFDGGIKCLCKKKKKKEEENKEEVFKKHEKKSRDPLVSKLS